VNKRVTDLEPKYVEIVGNFGNILPHERFLNSLQNTGFWLGRGKHHSGTKRQDFPVERLFYFDTDRNDIGKVGLSNKYFIGAVTGGRRTAGAVQKSREVF
jgi:hypothetical protein